MAVTERLRGSYARICAAIVLSLVTAGTFAVIAFDSNRHTNWGIPNENDRIYHPAGFSVVRPDGWKWRIHTREEQGLDEIYIYKSTYRYSESLQVTLDPEGAPFKDSPEQVISFQGHSAYVSWSADTIRGPSHISVHYRFDRSGHKVLLLLRVNGSYRVPPDGVSAFASTFRIEPPGRTH